MGVALGFDGGRGELVRLDGERLHFVADRAFAPGQPIVLKVELDGAPLSVETRSLGSKRRNDGRFDVRTRIVSLSDSSRERIATALTASS